MSDSWQGLTGREHNSWTDAAVLIPCFEKDGENHLLLTVRSELVLHHKGQICFPGGAVDESDKSLWHAALREAHEEIGLDKNQVELVRELSMQYTPSGFRVTPFLGKIIVPEVWTPNPHEIAEIFSAPFSHFKDRKNLKVEKFQYEGVEFLDPHFTVGRHTIWGMTGRILCEVFDISPAS